MSTQQQRLGPYELQQRLATDSMGETWKAFDAQQQRYVAIRIVRFNLQSMPDAIARFQQETQRLPSLQHPNIAQIFEIRTSQDPSQPEAYIVMEYLEGQLLSEYLRATSHEGNFPSANEITRIITPIASAIDYAHQHGVIHGAIRPANILLTKQNVSADNPIGEPKLLGFGTNSTQQALALSTEEVYYISPEQAQGHSENARSDGYALGVILYEMCTGTQPFQGDTPTDIMMQHIHAQPTSPALINPRILPALTAVIMRSLTKDPAARFPTASAMATATARAFNQQVPDPFSLSGSSHPGFSPPFSFAGSGPLPAVPDPRSSPAYFSPTSPQQISGPQPIIAGGGSPALTPPLSPSQTPAIRPSTGEIPVTHQWSQPYPAISTAPSTQPPAGAAPPAQKRTPFWRIAIIAVVLVAIIGSVLGALLWNRIIPPPAGPVASSVVGHAYFVSSGQLSPNTIQGTADRLQIDLQNIPAPQPGKSYYLWLQPDNDSRTDVSPVLLGSSSNGGRISISFPGNTQHNDLLANYSRFLMTEEDAGTTPANPSLDSSAWRYTSSFSQIKVGNPPYSVLDHLRHLLAQDPKLQNAGLVGGLDVWLFRNSLKILEASGSARDARSSGGGVPLMRRQIMRILDYLDGSQYVRTEKLPSDLPPVLIDPTIAKVAMLEFDVQNQEPPGYLKHIGNHLREISQAPGVTPEQKALAIRINQDIDNVQGWYTTMHRDAEQLIQMPPDQLTQPQAISLLDDLFTQANYAFAGQTDPNTNQVKEGVVQIHYNIERLATFDITPYKAS